MTKASPNSDQDLIEAIAKLLNEQNLAEIEIERDDLRVRVTRSYAAQAVQQVAVPAYAHAAPAPAAAATPVAPAGAAAGVAHAHDDLSSNPGTLTSPMVGTAYLSPEPGKPPFAPVGTKVSEGQTVLIIEAMKTMNQIPAHRSGTVARVLVDDGCAGRVRPATGRHRVRQGDVPEGPYRQPRRDRAPHPQGLQGARHPDGRRPLDRRLQCHARAPRRRERLHRPAARQGQLSQHPVDHGGLRDHRRRRGAPGLRLPERERALRPHPRRAQDHLHRPLVAPHRDHGRQDHRQEDGGGARHPGGARLGRRGEDRGRGALDRGRDRLSGADQGHRRRRRARHEGGAHRERTARSPGRRRAPRPRPPSATSRSTWRSTSASRGTSKCR